MVASDKDNDQLSYSWRWGDEYGSVIQRSIAAPYTKELSFKQEASATHIYTRTGVFKVSVIVKDEKGGIAESSITVKVKPRASTKIPRMCKLWFDGCNTCTRQEPGGIMACTQMYCPVSVKPAMCKEWFTQPAGEVKVNAKMEGDNINVSWEYNAPVDDNTGAYIVLRDTNGRAYKAQKVDLQKGEAKMDLNSFCNAFFSDAVDGNCSALKNAIKSGKKFYVEFAEYTPKNACFGYCAPGSARAKVLFSKKSPAFSIVSNNQGQQSSSSCLGSDGQMYPEGTEMMCGQYKKPDELSYPNAPLCLQIAPVVCDNGNWVTKY